MTGLARIDPAGRHIIGNLANIRNVKSKTPPLPPPQKLSRQFHSSFFTSSLTHRRTKRPNTTASPRPSPLILRPPLPDTRPVQPLLLHICRCQTLSRFTDRRCVPCVPRRTQDRHTQICTVVIPAL